MILQIGGYAPNDDTVFYISHMSYHRKPDLSKWLFALTRAKRDTLRGA